MWWAAGAVASGMFVSAITVQELEIGVLLAERRGPAQGAVLRRWLEARRSAALHVSDPRPVRDSLIAATALVHGTRSSRVTWPASRPRALRSSTRGSPLDEGA